MKTTKQNSSEVLPAGEMPDEADSLRNFSSVKYQKPKLNKPHLCPVCGTDDTEEFHYERLCNNNSCDVISYIPTS